MTLFMVIIIGILSFILPNVFVISAVWALWLSLKYNKIMLLVLLLIYAFCVAIVHFINQSDDKYSDTNHYFLGKWNVPIMGLCLVVALGLQLYVVYTKRFMK